MRLYIVDILSRKLPKDIFFKCNTNNFKRKTPLKPIT